MHDISVGFIGAGGIATSHAFALQSLKFYYPRVPAISFSAVTSARPETRWQFAQKFGFVEAVDYKNFIQQKDLDVVFILGPNNSHCQHLEDVLNMSSVTKIYLEKPVCGSFEEEKKMTELLKNGIGDRQIQVGFQMLQNSAIREALKLWNKGLFGRPIHFTFTLKHSDYLKSSYRAKRVTRLTPAPDGGAMADLGSHAVSLAVAFLGPNLKIKYAHQGGSFADVPLRSDLFSEISVYDPATGGVGSISASRVSSGTGDLMAFEICCENGTLRFSSQQPDQFEYFLEEKGNWVTVFTGNNYLPDTGFPSVHVSAGWLRSLIHAHYLFLMGNTNHESFVPDLAHGLAVQRLVRETAEHLNTFLSTR